MPGHPGKTTISRPGASIHCNRMTPLVVSGALAWAPVSGIRCIHEHVSSGTGIGSRLVLLKVCVHRRIRTQRD